MRRAPKPQQYVGKITLTFDFLRVPDDDGDAQPLPLIPCRGMLGFFKPVLPPAEERQHG